MSRLRKPKRRMACVITTRVPRAPTAVATVRVPDARGDRPKPSCNISGSRNGTAPMPMRSGRPPITDKRKVRWRRMARSIRGCSRRRTCRVYSHSSTAPSSAANQDTNTGTMARPAVSSAPSSKLKPNASKAKPPKSKGTGSTAGGSSLTKASVSAIASSPKGIFTKKIQRQLAKVTMAPPNKGPIMRPMTAGTVNQTMAATMPSGGTARSRIRRPTGTIMAPPSPCRMRNATSSGRLPATPHRAEPSENSAIARQNTRRAPSRSASQPLTGRNTAKLSR